MNKAQRILFLLASTLLLPTQTIAGSVIGNALLSELENVPGAFKIHVPDRWKKIQAGTKLSVIEPVTRAMSTQPTLIHVSATENVALETLDQLRSKLSTTGAWTPIRVGSLYGFIQIKSAQSSIRLLRSTGSILNVELIHRSTQDRDDLLSRVIQTLQSTR
jgi:hypothetical protein